jgi:hypothetical protein
MLHTDNSLRRSRSDSDMNMALRLNNDPSYGRYEYRPYGMIFKYNKETGLRPHPKQYFCSSHKALYMVDFGHHAIKNSEFKKCDHGECTNFAHYGYEYNGERIVLH